MRKPVSNNGNNHGNHHDFGNADRPRRKIVARRNSLFHTYSRPNPGRNINMKKASFRCLALAAVYWICSARAQVEYVDPSMGGQGFLLEPTRPTVSLPNSMVRVYPVRKDQLDDQIHSFPLTHHFASSGRTVLADAR